MKKNNVEMSSSNEEEHEKNKNNIYSWGFGKYGELGEKEINYSLEPIKINLILNKREEISKIECGEYHSSFITNNSNIYMFGKNIFGQLGLNHTNYIFEPELLKFEEKITIIKISLGGEHTLLLSEQKNLYSFGLNIFGQLGLGDNINRILPTNVDLTLNYGEEIKNISAGAQHSLILTSNNRIFSCGFGKNGSTGFGICDDINIFTQINFDNLDVFNNISKISSGVFHSGFIFDNNTKICIWGIGDVLKYNELNVLNFENIEEEIKIKDIKIGDDFFIILTENGNIYTSGSNSKGQLGIGNYDSNTKLNKVPISENIDNINVGYEHIIAITKNKKIFGWGSNEYGQLSQNEYSTYNTPTYLKNITNLISINISSGGYHNIGIFHSKLTSSNKNNIIKISSSLENNIQEIIESTNQTKEIKDKISSLTTTNNMLDKKLKILFQKQKELGVVPLNDLSSYSRNFNNNFEITLSELDIDENSEIGKGTFGEVRKGIWRGEEVAIKFLKSSMLSSQESIKSFIDECNIMKNLHHPNILLFMGACTTGPEFFVVTEYCENGNLFELLHINQSQKLTYEDVRRIALEIAYGVNYLHSFKPPILHRDLKSMNVLLDRNLQVKLADFGNTKYLDIQMTKQKGTFQWMAPEVIRGNVYSEKSDVFSFGIIMNELVMRIPPYQGKDKKEVARKVVRNPEYRPIIGKKVPKDWIDLMVKCYAHEEKKRPGFNEIIDCLKKMKLPKDFIYVPK